jgi:hypothetical protein
MPRFVPAAQVNTRILLATLLWSGIGLMLLTRGVLTLSGSGREWWLGLAVLLGTLKSRLVLDRVVLENMTRLRGLDGDRCIGGVYSVKTWLLVAAMIVLGRLLRLSPLPVWLIGLLYVTVGWALFWSSRLGWSAWRQSRRLSATDDEKNET